MGAIVTTNNNGKKITTYSDLKFRLRLDIAMPNREDKKGIRISDDLSDPEKGLDMDFHIIKSDSQTPDQSMIKIYNLSTKIYDLIYQYATEFTLYCAFSDDDYTIMYKGYPWKTVQHSKKTILTSNQGFMLQDANAGRRGQNDLETEITLRNWGRAWLNKTYRKPVNTERILNDCILALGLPKGNMDEITHRNLNGYRATGDVRKTLNYLGQLLGFDYGLHNGSFCLFNKKRNEIRKYGIYLHSGNSSIPEKQDDIFKFHKGRKATKKEASKPDTIEHIRNGYAVETRLLPFLQVGTTIKCDFKSKNCQGYKYIYKIEHTGSNYGGIEAKTKVYFV